MDLQANNTSNKSTDRPPTLLERLERAKLRIRAYEAAKPRPPTPEPEPVVEDSDGEPPPVVLPPGYVPPTPLYKRRAPRKKKAGTGQTEDNMGAAVAADFGIPFVPDECMGKPAPEDLIKLIPFGAIARYPYNSVPAQWLQPLATIFFDKDKVYERDWEFYYIAPSPFNDAIPFVAVHQVQELIDEINEHFLEAHITLREDIIIDFSKLPLHLRPCCAGKYPSRAQYNSLVYHISQESDMVLPDPGQTSLEDFKKKMEAAAVIHRAKGKKARAEKFDALMAKRQGLVKQSLEAQRYLGLLPPNKHDLLIPELCSLSINPLDVTKSSPHPFRDEPIFIAIDAEAWEKSQRMVTEVGVATLDTRDLQGKAPGEFGKDWHKQIRARHFRILEYKDKVNREYVQGCPDNFEFGQSEFVKKVNIASVLASCFREPFSKQLIEDEDEDVNAEAEPSTTEPEKRNIVLVGHDLNQDINYCRDIGFDVLNRGNMIGRVDTANLYRALTKDPNARSLGTILYDFDMTGWHLHNAGNDATYTLHIMLAICVKAATDRGDKDAAKKLQENIDKRIEETVEQARERAKADAEGWDEPKDEVGDSSPDMKEVASSEDPHFRFHTVNGAPLDV